MSVEVIAVSESAVDAASAALGRGESVVVPTDTVYGLAALASNEQAVDHLFALKDRPVQRSIALIVADLEQAKLLGAVDAVSQQVAEQLWPGPLTMVVQRRFGLGDWLGREDGTIGIRCPAHEWLRSLAARVGPLAVTSANRTGSETASFALDAAASLTGPVGLIVDGGACTAMASTVARMTESGEWVVFRDGPVTVAMLQAASAKTTR